MPNRAASHVVTRPCVKVLHRGMSICAALVRCQGRPTPEAKLKLYTHLNFGGNCAEAFRFYATHLGGTITMMMRQADIRGGAHGHSDAIVHARMDLGDTVLIGNDVPAAHFERMRSVYLYLAMDSAAEVER